jgi:hypothetical protein
MKHTPGPWRASQDEDTRGNPTWRIDSPTVSLIASLSYANAGERAEGIHDAHLIAAAPELLAALEVVMEPFSKFSDDNLLFDWMRQARAAIAKAKG